MTTSYRGYRCQQAVQAGVQPLGYDPQMTTLIVGAVARTPAPL
jgi:hypothetical protein